MLKKKNSMAGIKDYTCNSPRMRIFENIDQLSAREAKNQKLPSARDLKKKVSNKAFQKAMKLSIDGLDRSLRKKGLRSGSENLIKDRQYKKVNRLNREFKKIIVGLIKIVSETAKLEPVS